MKQSDISKDKVYNVKFVHVETGKVLKEENIKFLFGYYGYDHHKIYYRYLESGKVKDVYENDIKEIHNLKNKRITNFLLEVETIQHATEETILTDEIIKELEAKVAKNPGYAKSIDMSIYEDGYGLKTHLVDLDKPEITNSFETIRNGEWETFTGGWDSVDDKWIYKKSINHNLI